MLPLFSPSVHAADARRVDAAAKHALKMGNLTYSRQEDNLIRFAGSIGSLTVGSSVTNQSDDRSSLASAMGWASLMTTISLGMALPGLIGLWLDRWLGTGVLFVIVGVILGFSTGIWQLIKLTTPHDNK